MLVSIGVPTYNGARYLPSAIDSLIAQDHSDLEIIISDNGSTDDTPAICTEYARRDGRIRYFREPVNRGAVWNFRRVLELSRGDYFAWHGDDDLRSPSFVSASLRRLMATDAILCTTRMSAIDMEGNPSPMEIGPPLQGDHADEIIRCLFRSRYWADVYGLMRTDAAQKLGLRDTWGCDVVLTLELGLRGRVVHEPNAETLIRIDSSKTTEGISERSGIELRWNKMVGELVGAFHRSPLSAREKVLLYPTLVRGLLENDTVRYALASENGPFSTLMRALERARNLKRRLERLTGRKNQVDPAQ